MIRNAPDAWAEMAALMAGIGEPDLKIAYTEMLDMAEDTGWHGMARCKGTDHPANEPDITVFDTYEDIPDKCADARSFFANDPRRVTSITGRVWIKVNS